MRNACSLAKTSMKSSRDTTLLLPAWTHDDCKKKGHVMAFNNSAESVLVANQGKG